MAWHPGTHRAFSPPRQLADLWTVADVGKDGHMDLTDPYVAETRRCAVILKLERAFPELHVLRGFTSTGSPQLGRSAAIFPLE
jgi:hypothetical protein